jgi:Serine dehydrogenase proteinase
MTTGDESQPATESSDESQQSTLAQGPFPAVAPTKTPMYAASNAARYQRQTLIREIQRVTQRCLLTYTCGVAASIERDDIVGFVDMLHNVEKGRDIELMLHTPGGDIDAAEKLITLVRRRVDESSLRVIIPDYAKSAGTLIALGADTIVMSDTSELGPIDPQVVLKDGNGNLIRHSILSYLDAYETHAEALRRNPNDRAAQIMLSKLDPATVTQFKAVKDRARKLAEDQLRRGMFRSSSTPGNFTKIASDLLDTTRWPSHGQMIGWEDAKQIGLSVEYRDPKDAEWQLYWQLYCLQRLEVKDKQKLFESDYASLPFDSTTA